MYERFNSKKKKKKEKKNSPLQQPTGTQGIGYGYCKRRVHVLFDVPNKQQKIGEVFEDSRHPYPQNSKFTDQRGNSTEATQG